MQKIIHEQLQEQQRILIQKIQHQEHLLRQFPMEQFNTFSNPNFSSQLQLQMVYPMMSDSLLSPYQPSINLNITNNLNTFSGEVIQEKTQIIHKKMEKKQNMIISIQEDNKEFDINNEKFEKKEYRPTISHSQIGIQTRNKARNNNSNNNNNNNNNNNFQLCIDESETKDFSDEENTNRKEKTRVNLPKVKGDKQNLKRREREFQSEESYEEVGNEKKLKKARRFMNPTLIRDLDSEEEQHGDHSKKIGLYLPVCGAVYFQLNVLIAHECKHTGEKPFKCDYDGCDFATISEKYLRAHKFVHLNHDEKPHACQYCDYRTARIHNLLMHERIHTGEKPFACEYCDERFSRNDRLQCHIRIHTGKYACKYCDFKTLYPASLKSHVLNHEYSSFYQ